MARKMSKREAIEKCRKVWAHLAKTEEDTKEGAYKALKLKEDYGHCPACEYNITHDHKYCNEECIIKWPSNKWCSDKGSPYYSWRNGNERKKYAKQIILLCDQALTKLPKRRVKK